MNTQVRRLPVDEGPAQPHRVAGYVRSAWRALAVLETVAEAPAGLALREIVQALELPPSSAHGLLVTLAEAGYLRRDPDTLRYRLGPRLGKLFQAFQAQTDIVALAAGVMDRLRQATGATVSLTVRQDDQVVFVDKRAADSQVQIVNPVGTRLPAHATGCGKAMLAVLPDSTWEQFYPQEALSQCTPYTLGSRAGLRRALAAVRQRGYAFDEQESELGVWAVAAAIRDVQGLPAGALSVFMPLFRVTRRQRSGWGQLVRKAADEVSAALGYAGASVPTGRRAAALRKTETPL